MFDDYLDLENLNYPQLSLETDDIVMDLTIKKDYSSIKDLEERKKELLKDLDDFIKEFSESPESLDFMKFYDF